MQPFRDAIRNDFNIETRFTLILMCMKRALKLILEIDI